MRSVSAMVTGSLMLCLYIATFAAGAGFDSHVMKDSLRQLGHSFIKDKYLEAQKGETRQIC